MKNWETLPDWTVEPNPGIGFEVMEGDNVIARIAGVSEEAYYIAQFIAESPQMAKALGAILEDEIDPSMPDVRRTSATVALLQSTLRSAGVGWTVPQEGDHA